MGQILNNIDINRLIDILVSGNELPLSIGMEIVNRCNVSCVMCAGAKQVEKNGKMPYKSMSVKDFHNMIQGVWLAGVTFAGAYSEPFLNRDIICICKSAKEINSIVSIVTNGTLLNKKNISDIIDTRVDNILVSIHGSDKYTAESIMIGSNFDDIVNSLILIKELKSKKKYKMPFVTITFVAQKNNYKSMLNMVDIAKKAGADRLVIKPILTPGAVYKIDNKCRDWFHRNDLSSFNELSEVIKNTKELSISKGINFSFLDSKIQEIDMKKRDDDTTRLCDHPFVRTNAWDNFLSICCAQSMRNYPILIPRNNAPGWLMDSWDSQEYRLIRRSLLTGDMLPTACSNCTLAPWVKPEVQLLYIALLRNKAKSTELLRSCILKLSCYYSEPKESLVKIGKFPPSMPSVH